MVGEKVTGRALLTKSRHVSLPKGESHSPHRLGGQAEELCGVHPTALLYRKNLHCLSSNLRAQGSSAWGHIRAKVTLPVTTHPRAVTVEHIFTTLHISHDHSNCGRGLTADAPPQVLYLPSCLGSYIIHPPCGTQTKKTGPHYNIHTIPKAMITNDKSTWKVDYSTQ